jgi:hypothetical protein
MFCSSRVLTSGTNNESLVLTRSAETSIRKCQEKKSSFMIRGFSFENEKQNLPEAGQVSRVARGSAVVFVLARKSRISSDA